MKKFLNKALVDSNTNLFKIVSNWLAILTIISIACVVLETVTTLSQYHQIFFVAEWIAVAFFSLEYVGRLLVSKPRWKYTLSFFGVVDLVAILPTFLGLGNFTFLKSARAFRIIRLLRMMRLAKVSREGIMTDENTSVITLNILLYFATLLTALLITGTAMHLAEPQSPNFVSIPGGMWWSLKVFMSGIPVTAPATALGEVFFVLTRFIGLLLFGLLVGVVGNVFKTFLFSDKK